MYETGFGDVIGKGLEVLATELGCSGNELITAMLTDSIERYKRDDNYRAHVRRLLGSQT